MNTSSKSNLVVVVLIALIACTQGKQSPNDEVKSESEDWKEMEDFHMLMAESFHPFMDSSNLEPAKANALQLSMLAEKWQSASPPSRMDNEEVKQKLEQLKDETVTFNSLVESGDDKQTGESLTRMHDLFHGIQDIWYKQ
jgi:hypothetical protein